MVTNFYFKSTKWDALLSDWEGKGPCSIVPFTWKIAHKSLCRIIRNGPLKISKSLKKAEKGPMGKNLFPINGAYYFGTQIVTKTKKGRDFLCMKSPDRQLFVLSRYNKEWMDRRTDRGTKIMLLAGTKLSKELIYRMLCYFAHLVGQKEGSKNTRFPRFVLWISRQKVYCLKELELRPLYGFLYADVDKSVWVWYEDGLMTFCTSN